jgi:hypothetical protein
VGVTTFTDESPEAAPLLSRYQVRSNGGTGQNARPNSALSDPAEFLPDPTD